MFDLHNRHTYSEELVKAKKAYSRYTATIGVLTMNNDLLSRAVVFNEFRTATDLVDRISGGSGPAGLKAVAPTGSEAISITIPAEEQSVSILGEKLSVVRIDGRGQLHDVGPPHRAHQQRQSRRTRRRQTGARRAAKPCAAPAQDEDRGIRRRRGRHLLRRAPGARRAGRPLRRPRRAARRASRRAAFTSNPRSLATCTSAVVHAVAAASEVGKADLVLVCVKAHQTAGDCGRSRRAPRRRHGHRHAPERRGVRRDARAAVRPGSRVSRRWSTSAPPSSVQAWSAMSRRAPSRSAPDPGSDPSRLRRLRDVLATSGQPVRISDDLRRDRWRKLIWNASFNTVSAVTEREPRELLALPGDARAHRRRDARSGGGGTAQGIDLSESDVDDQIAWTERAGAIRTSTMVDRERGREMEIDALIGVVVRLGRAHGVATPLQPDDVCVADGNCSRKATASFMNLQGDSFHDRHENPLVQLADSTLGRERHGFSGTRRVGADGLTRRVGATEEERRESVRGAGCAASGPRIRAEVTCVESRSPRESRPTPSPDRARRPWAPARLSPVALGWRLPRGRRCDRAAGCTARLEDMVGMAPPMSVAHYGKRRTTNWG